MAAVSTNPSVTTTWQPQPLPSVRSAVLMHEGDPALMVRCAVEDVGERREVQPTRAPEERRNARPSPAPTATEMMFSDWRAPELTSRPSTSAVSTTVGSARPRKPAFPDAPMASQYMQAESVVVGTRRASRAG